MASKRKVTNVTKRREALEKELEHVARIEAEQKIEIALTNNARYRKLRQQEKELAKTLHNVRVTLSRKIFGIKVRHERLAAIPREIEAIELERQKVQRKIDVLEQQQRSLITSIDSIKDQVANEFKEVAA